MSNEFSLSAEARSDLGKGASRRLRRNSAQVPAIVYGGDQPPQSISLLAKDIAKLIENEAAFSHLIALKIANKTERVLIKALQRHPAKDYVMHVDFLRVRADHELTTVVPLHFINEAEAVGVRDQGGELFRIESEVEISCLPKDLPEFIEVDVANLKLDESLHLSDLTLPRGVHLVALQHDNNLQVAAVHMPRVSAEPTEEEGSAESGEAAKDADNSEE